MGGLPRPEVAPGARRDLVDALHDLHHRAGWPSLRALAREAGCSHTTVSAVFSSPKLPSWGMLELVVEAMDGDAAEFHRLWLAASDPTEPGAAAAPRIAGRRTEAAAVRRHLESGTGLLLITGEAGIGKTRLVSAVAQTSDTFVAAGFGRPLSTAAPLLPIADALAEVYEVDEGRWFKEALADCPPYVAATLRPLLPQLEATGSETTPTPDDWSRQRLFTAVRSALTALCALRPLAVLVEDLHWADTATLDLLEHLVSRSGTNPVLGTYRLEDPSTPQETLKWFTRVNRLSTVADLELGPLTREESAEQLALLGGSPPSAELVEHIHRRSAGQPLFTEQLAAQAEQPVGEAPLPRLLADLLDERLAGLTGPLWAIMRALGVADRSLTDTELSDVTSLTGIDLTSQLHDLDQRRLLAKTLSGHDVQLRHPLLAEAVRRRLVAGEAAAEHRHLALALAASPEPSAAEIATHWQGADDPDQEIVWRVRAAREAGRRFAVAQEAGQWLRVLELWPDGADSVGVPPVRRPEVYLAAMDALEAAGTIERALVLADEAMRQPGFRDADTAGLYRRAAKYRGFTQDPAAGLEMAERSIEVYRRLPPSEGLIEALHIRAMRLRGLGRYEEGIGSLSEALSVDDSLSGTPYRRTLLARLASLRSMHDLDDAVRLIGEAARTPAGHPDPVRDLEIAVWHTDLLMIAGRSAEEVEAAARPALESARECDFEGYRVADVQTNVANAMIRAGQVARAAAFVVPATDGPVTVDFLFIHARRAAIDLRRGLLEEARRRIEPIVPMGGMGAQNRAEILEVAAEVHLWCGRPRRALDELLRLLDEALETEAAGFLGMMFVLAARAAADLAEAGPASGRPAVRRDLLEQLRALRRRARTDPLGADAVPAQRFAFAATWNAELARLAGAQTVELWVTAAAEWDKLTRPHESAYCRWRGAQVALREGQGTVARRLLRRATQDAREHVPLLAVIRQTSEGA